MADQEEERWLTVADVAERLRVSQETVRRWIRDGRLPVLDLGGPKVGYRIKESDLLTFVTERYGPLAKSAA